MDGRALAEELGVRDDGDVGAAEGPLDDPGGADRHGRLVDHHRLARAGAARSRARRPRCRRGRPSRRRPAAWARTGRRTRSRRTAFAAPSTKRSRPSCEPFAHEVVEAGLEDRDLAALEALDLVGVDVGADHVVADVGEAGAGGEPDVARPDDSDLAHGMQSSELTTAAPARGGRAAHGSGAAAGGPHGAGPRCRAPSWPGGARAAADRARRW